MSEEDDEDSDDDKDSDDDEDEDKEDSDDDEDEDKEDSDDESDDEESDKSRSFSDNINSRALWRVQAPSETSKSSRTPLRARVKAEALSPGFTVVNPGGAATDTCHLKINTM